MLERLEPHKTQSSIRIWKQGLRKRARFDRDIQHYYESRLALYSQDEMDLTTPLNRICNTTTKSHFRISRPIGYIKRGEPSPKGLRSKTLPKEHNPQQTSKTKLKRIQELDMKTYLQSQFSPTVRSRLSPLTRFKKSKFLLPMDFWNQRICLSP